MADDSLNDKQLKFCTEYAKHGNANEAYAKAYPGTKRSSVEASAYRMLANAGIKEKVNQLRAETKANSKITREKIAKELAEMGFTNVDVAELKFGDKIKALELLAKILGFLDGNSKGAGDSEEQIDKRLSESLTRVADKLSKRGSKP